MSTKVYEPRKGKLWVVEATAAIARLEVSAAYRAPLSGPHCGEWTPAGLVTRTFRFTGKGRDIVLPVTCHAKMMVAMFKVLRKCPSYQVGGSLASYRTFTMQNNLYQAWIHHAEGSHRATSPCYGYHRCGRALDAFYMAAEEREAWTTVRVGGLRCYDLGDIDPPHVTLGTRG